MMHTIRFASLVLAIGSALPLFSDAIPDWKDQMAHVLAFDDGEMEYFGSSWRVMFSDLGFSNIAIVVPFTNIHTDGCLWMFSGKNNSQWQMVGDSVWARYSDFYFLSEDDAEIPVLYERLASPISSNGVYRTWAEYEKGVDDIVVTNELLQAFVINSNGIPHTETIPGGIIPRLWTDTFQSLKRVNFDIYSGTNLTHSTLFPKSTAPVAPSLTAVEKSAFASWFRSCAATNAVPATNAVLAVFADDDLDGRMDAFAALDVPPDADGARRWTFCRNMEDGWLFYGLESPDSLGILRMICPLFGEPL